MKHFLRSVLLLFFAFAFVHSAWAQTNEICDNLKVITTEGTQNETNTGQTEYWYSFQTPNDAQNHDLTVSASFGTTISIFNFPCVATDLIIASAPGFGDVTATGLLPNTAYLIKIEESGSPFDLSSFDVTSAVSSGGGGGGGGTINNTCADAIVITSTGTQIVTDTQEAEYWYQYVMPAVQSTLQLSAAPGANIAVTVYTGTDCNNLNQVAAGSSANVLDVTTLSPNEVVWIKWGAELGASGSFVLNALPTGGGGGGSNTAPTNIQLTAQSINDGSGPFTVVGTLSTVDTEGGIFTYEFVPGEGATDNALFDFMPVMGDTDLITQFTADHATKSTYLIRIRSTDGGGLFVEKAFTITVNPPSGGSNSPPTDILLSATTINENVAANTSVGTLSSTDTNGDTHTYALVDATNYPDNAAFNILGSSLRITNRPDFETKNSYSIRVRTTDQGSLSFEKQFTISINDVSNASQTITFNALSNATYGDVIPTSSLGATSTSPLPITYSIVSGTATISGGNLTITGIGTITIEATQTGDADYTAATPQQQSFEALAKVLTISGISINDKPYDGTTAATLTGSATLNGVINNDDVTLSGSPTGMFSDKNAGNNKIVSVTGYSLTGTGAANYALPTVELPQIKRFFGVTTSGVSPNQGTLFEYNLETGTLTKKIDFIGSNGSFPNGTLTALGNKLYGVTYNGGTNNNGILYEYDPANGNLTNKVDFNGIDGKSPVGSLVVLGNKIYGLTVAGGTNNIGTLFEFDPVNGILIKKVDFNGSGNGRFPRHLTIFDGKLYGITNQGGVNDNGVLFEYDPATTTLIKKVDFDGTIGREHGGLTSYGNKLYGMAYLGGTNNKGTLYEYDPATGSLTKKLDFDGVNGGTPKGRLTALNNKLYGLTTSGGTNDRGIIFEYDPANGSLTKKFDFIDDGRFPQGTFTVLDGVLYASSGGGATNEGTIIAYDPSTESLIKKVDFGADQMASPSDLLLYTSNSGSGFTTTANITAKPLTITGISAENKVYDGTTTATLTGTATLSGVINGDNVALSGTPTATFADPDAANNKTVTVTGYTLTGAKAANYSLPEVAVTQTKNLFFGMTSEGGTNSSGTLFEYDPATGTLTKKIDFTVATNGSFPQGSLTLSGGKLYGLTSSGGVSGKGTLFEYDPATGMLTTKIDFINTNGSNPYGSLAVSGGKLYGLTSEGGTNSSGTLFEYDPATGMLTTKIDFTATTNGSFPQGSLTLSGGKLYGLTFNGGANNRGTLFEYDPATGTLTKKIDFNGTNNGSFPRGSLTVSGGKLYGMTSEGGTNDKGVLFEFDPATGTLTKKIDFIGTNGSSPYGSLTVSGGKLYGLTLEGGANYSGTLFEYDPATGTLTTKIDFTETTNGSFPQGSLTVSDGKLYGMTSTGGGVSIFGTLFEYDPATGTLTKKIDFDGANGAYPVGDLHLATVTIPTTAVGFTTTASISKADQAITFNTITTEVEVDGAPFALGASSSSTLPVSYTTNPASRITIDANGNATPVGAGIVEITASQSGNTNYNAATAVAQTLCIMPKAPVIITQTAADGAIILTTTSQQSLTWYRDGEATAVFTGVTLNPSSLTPVIGTYYAKVDASGGCMSKPSNKFKVDIVTGLEATAQDVSVWPNPATDYLFIEGVSAEVVSKIVQMNGSVLDVPSQYANGSLQVNISTLTPGFYIMKIVDKNSTRYARFIKN